MATGVFGNPPPRARGRRKRHSGGTTEVMYSFN